MRWAAPRMRQLRKLGADLTATGVLKFLTTPARSCAPHDWAGLHELELFGVDDDYKYSTATEGLLRQACVLSDQQRMAALEASRAGFIHLLHVRHPHDAPAMLAGSCAQGPAHQPH